MSQLVTVQVTELKKHPNANKLKIAKVFDGANSYEVVCGASNITSGIITVLAKVGSKTPKNLEIKISDLRGVQSHGMLCSPKDLGVSDETGIVDLPKDTSLGMIYTDLPIGNLSSTAWYDLKLIDNHYENLKSKTIRVSKENLDDGNLKLISQTYWDGSDYKYRHWL